MPRLNFQEPLQQSTLQEWWLTQRVRFLAKERKWFDGLVCTVSHALWKNRNAHCFNNVQQQYSSEGLAKRILDEFAILRSMFQAGVGVLDNG